MRAEVSCALYALPSMSIDQSVPMWRFTERMVRSGLVIACRLATSPTSTSPVFENATTDGVVRDPSALGMTVGSPASRVEATEFVVPRWMPTAWDRGVSPFGGILSVTLSTFLRARPFPLPRDFSLPLAAADTPVPDDHE